VGVASFLDALRRLCAHAHVGSAASDEARGRRWRREQAQIGWVLSQVDTQCAEAAMM
jgi:hypothetical protein